MLKRKYDNQADIPAGMESLYTEKDGKFILTGVEGVEQIDNLAKVQKALNDERAAHKATTAKLAAFGELTAEDAAAAVTERDELKLKIEAGGGKPDESKIAELVKARVALATAPLDKKVQDLTKERDTAVAERDGLATARKRDRISAAIAEKAAKAGVLPGSVNRIVSLLAGQFDLDDSGKPITREGDSVLPGLDVDQVINDLKTTDPYFWPTSQGGGASGGQSGGVGGVNFWSKAGWNLTEQGRMVAKDPSKAAAMAKAAGVDINAIEPKQ